MSDEPERLFSEAGDVLAPKRRHMTGQTLAQLLTLKRWQRDGLITLDESLFERAITAADQPALGSSQSMAKLSFEPGQEPERAMIQSPDPEVPLQASKSSTVADLINQVDCCDLPSNQGDWD